jgi:mono/diheme cytochrome c family protein
MLRLVDRGLSIISWLAAALVIVLLFAGPGLIGAKSSTPASPYGTPTSSAAPGGPASRPLGARVFASAGCGSCHTLKAAGAAGTVGPNLDQVHITAAGARAIVRTGAGVMPSFSGKLSSAEIAAVADYVTRASGH